MDCYGPVDFLWMISSASAPIIEQFMAGKLWADTVPDYLAASPMAMIRPPVWPFLIVHGTKDIGEVLERGAAGGGG